MSKYLEYFCVIKHLEKKGVIDKPVLSTRLPHSASLFYSMSFQHHGSNGILVFPVVILNNIHCIRFATLKIHAHIFSFDIEDIIKSCST